MGYFWHDQALLVPRGLVNPTLPEEPKALCADSGADPLTHLAGAEECPVPCPQQNLQAVSLGQRRA